jgi:CubicO group peptidase (beta-lactamase class C family)
VKKLRPAQSLRVFLLTLMVSYLTLGHQDKPRATGINRLDSSIEKEVDSVINQELPLYHHLNLALVFDGKIIFSRCYGKADLQGDYAYASVSKPVTSLIIMQLLDEGRIKNLDDNIWKYAEKYAGSMPESYKQASLTVRQLLSHTSGIPHNDEPVWKNGKLNLKFKPGTAYKYSTPGYGILGDIIEAVTGKSYGEVLKTYIEKPIGASSFTGYESFITPGAFVHSTVEDMARFSIGVMNDMYVASEILLGEILKPVMQNYGLGWSCSQIGSDDITASHSGSNGTPRAYLMIKPLKKLSVSLLATRKSARGGREMGIMVHKLISILEGMN